MSIVQRLLLGAVAGLAIVIVRIIGPDHAYVTSIITNYASGADLSGMVSYVLVGLGTIILGTISGIFANENDTPRNILIFCASFPGLISSLVGEEREPLPVDQPELRAEYHQPVIAPFGLFVSSAQAQTADGPLVCEEETFGAKVAGKTLRYLSGGNAARQEIYGVVVASKTDFTEAAGLADAYTKKGLEGVAVGCRRPGNKFFPVMFAESMSRDEAEQKIGEWRASGVLLEDPYLSAYEFRKPIYLGQP